jgi:hypothetical protein
MIIGRTLATPISAEHVGLLVKRKGNNGGGNGNGNGSANSGGGVEIPQRIRVLIQCYLRYLLRFSSLAVPH